MLVKLMLLPVVLLCVFSTVQADVYKSTNSDGIITYSNIKLKNPSVGSVQNKIKPPFNSKYRNNRKVTYKNTSFIGIGCRWRYSPHVGGYFCE